MRRRDSVLPDVPRSAHRLQRHVQHHPTADPDLRVRHVNYNISSIVLRYVGGILSVTAGSFTLTQPGPTSAAGPSGGSFDVSYRVSGGCIETYRLVGMFTDADHFTGTWTSTYVEVDGSCAFSGCAPLTVAVTGVRAP